MNILFINWGRGIVGFLLITVIILISACGSSRNSSQKINEADNVFEQLVQAEAMDYAEDAYREAQMKLEEARQLAEKGKHKKAALRADEAMVAAELAEVKTLSQKANESLGELKASIKSLKDKLEEYK